jgi:hypothetical protein
MLEMDPSSSARLTPRLTDSTSIRKELTAITKLSNYRKESSTLWQQFLLVLKKFMKLG